ncbi:hypothetical protein LXL04_032690 [Taraxacum kok-saghyz]
MWPPFIWLASCCYLLKHTWNIRSTFVRLSAYTICSDFQGLSSYTKVLSHRLKKLGKFNDTETLHHRKKELSRNSALLFARQLKESGFKHDVETYMTIIRSLCHSGMYVRLYNLFNYVIEEDVGIQISHLLDELINEKLIKVVEVLVKVYASIGIYHKAMHTLLETKNRSGLMVSTGTCNFVLNEVIEWDKVDRAESFCEQLKRNGFIPNVYTYGILMKGYRKKGHLVNALHVFKQMEEDGIKPNAFIYGTFIHGLCSKGQSAIAFKVVKKLMDSNKTVDVFAYTCVIRGFIKESKLQDAEDVFLDMKLRDVVPDAHCYGALIRGYCQNRDIMKALDLCDEMESRGITPDYVIVMALMQEMHSLGMIPEALDKFKGFMWSGFFLDEVSFNIGIYFACRLGRMDDAMGLMEEMKGRNMKPWKMHYRTLMDGYCRWGQPSKALYMFEEMMRNGLRPDSTTYQVLARGGVFLPFYMIFKN